MSSEGTNICEIMWTQKNKKKQNQCKKLIWRYFSSKIKMLARHLVTDPGLTRKIRENQTDTFFLHVTRCTKS